MSCSKTKEKELKILMGRKFCTLLELPFLGTGVTYDVLKSAGKTDDERDRLKMKVKGLTKASEQALRI